MCFDKVDWFPILDLLSSRLLKLLVSELNISLTDAMKFYYSSITYQLIIHKETQYRLYGDLYILEDLVTEYNEVRR